LKRFVLAVGGEKKQGEAEDINIFIHLYKCCLGQVFGQKEGERVEEKIFWFCWLISNIIGLAMKLIVIQRLTLYKYCMLFSADYS